MLGSSPTPPPPEAHELHVWVLDDDSQLSNLPASIFDVVVRRYPLTKFTFGGTADKMMLIAGAVAADALTQGLPPTIVRLFEHDNELILDVADHDISGPQPRNSGSFGIRLARHHGLPVGWYICESAKHIWVRFQTDGSEQPT